MYVGAAGVVLGLALRFGFDVWAGTVVVWTGLLLIGSAIAVARLHRREESDSTELVPSGL